MNATPLPFPSDRCITFNRLGNSEAHTLENFVTHQSQKFWLSPDCSCQSVYPYAKPSKKKS